MTVPNVGWKIGVFACETLAIALVYAAFACVGHVLAIAPGIVTPIWPASGFALVVALRCGHRGWLGLWLGSFLGACALFDFSTTASATRTILTGAATGPGIVMQAQVGAFLLRRCCHHDVRFGTIREVFCFVGTQSVACLLSATCGVLVLHFGEFVHRDACGYTWLTWYLGDLVGVIAFAPLLMTWPLAARLNHARGGAFESSVIVATGAVLAALIFSENFEVKLSSVTIGVVLWAAIRGNQFTVTATVLVIATLAIWGTSLGQGPFSSTTTNIALLSLQLFIASATVTGLSVAAALDERERSATKLVSETDRRLVAEQELTLAAEIQRTLQPKVAPRIAGLDIAGRCIPAASAAADFYDFLPLSDGRMGIVVGDVSGHGVGPALIMASTRQALRSLKDYHHDLGELLTAVNLDLCEGNGVSRFVTVFFAAIDAAQRQLQWSSAGHASLLLTATGEFVELPALSFPLGINPEESIPTSETIPFETGSILILLTDGLIEAQNAAHELFGKQRLRDALLRHRSQPADNIADSLINAITEFCTPIAPRDDMTIVVVCSVPRDGGHAQIG